MLNILFESVQISEKIKLYDHLYCEIIGAYN